MEAWALVVWIFFTFMSNLHLHTLPQNTYVQKVSAVSYNLILWLVFLSLLPGIIHNPTWRFWHLLSLLPGASIINHQLVGVTGAASAAAETGRGRRVKLSRWEKHARTDRLSKPQTAEKTRRDTELRAAGRRPQTKGKCVTLNQIRQLGRETECDMTQHDDIIHVKVWGVGCNMLGQ